MFEIDEGALQPVHHPPYACLRLHLLVLKIQVGNIWKHVGISTKYCLYFYISMCYPVLIPIYANAVKIALMAVKHV